MLGMRCAEIARDELAFVNGIRCANARSENADLQFGDFDPSPVQWSEFIRHIIKRSIQTFQAICAEPKLWATIGVSMVDWHVRNSVMNECRKRG